MIEPLTKRPENSVTQATPLIVNSCALTPDPSGALIWSARRLVVVADLHLEKG